MLVEYKYRLYNGGRRGFYQCDRADFMAFWRKRPLLVWCVVVVGGSAWFWSPPEYKGGGWRKTSVAFARNC